MHHMQACSYCSKRTAERCAWLFLLGKKSPFSGFRPSKWLNLVKVSTFCPALISSCLFKIPFKGADCGQHFKKNSKIKTAHPKNMRLKSSVTGNQRQKNPSLSVRLSLNQFEFSGGIVFKVRSLNPIFLPFVPFQMPVWGLWLCFTVKSCSHDHFW